MAQLLGYAIDALAVIPCKAENYVHHNAVKHGVVRHAADYPWCSAAWFERTATPAQVKTIYAFNTDRVIVKDEF